MNIPDIANDQIREVLRPEPVSGATARAPSADGADSCLMVPLAAMEAEGLIPHYFDSQGSFATARVCSTIQPSSTAQTSICCVNLAAKREGYR